MDKRTCQICGERSPRSMETHHIIPRRYGGSDDVENLVTLCANCHGAVESIYSNDRWESVGASKDDTNTDQKQPPDEAGKELLFNLVKMLREVDKRWNTPKDVYRFVHTETSIPTELRINLRNSIKCISQHKDELDDSYELYDRKIYYGIAKRESEKGDTVIDTSVQTHMTSGSKRCIAFSYEKLAKKLDLKTTGLAIQ